METYIIRIYRRYKKDPSNMVGVVEKVGSRNNENFKNINELVEILKNTGRNDKDK